MADCVLYWNHMSNTGKVSFDVANTGKVRFDMANMGKASFDPFILEIPKGVLLANGEGTIWNAA